MLVYFEAFVAAHEQAKRDLAMPKAQGRPKPLALIHFHAFDEARKQAKRDLQEPSAATLESLGRLPN
ncbi:MAG: hypothetical protein Q7S26_00880 [bacterium]|nr:hypothetical protein [bacterium]